MKIKKNPDVVLLGMFSSKQDPLIRWEPESLEDVFFYLDIEIGLDDNSVGVQSFNVCVATPEALRSRAKEFLISPNRLIVVDCFDYFLLKRTIQDIINKSKRRNWSDTCIVLQRYFSYDFEDYSY